MKNFILGFLVAAVLAAGSAWLLLRKPSQPPAQVAQAQKYYCPMHPSYVSDKPGDCPICSMRLVPMPVEKAEIKNTNAKHEPEQRRVLYYVDPHES